MTRAGLIFRYKFEPAERSTCVIRDLDLTIQIPGVLQVAGPLVAWAFRNENVRILAELKRYVEVQPKQRDLKTLIAAEAPQNDLSFNSKEESNG